MATYVPLHPLPLQFQHVVTSLNLLGGSIEFFLAGTSTPTNLFSDSIGTSIGTSITLNAGGMPESGGNVITLWRDDSIALKLILKNAAGGTISSADNLPAPRTLSGVPFHDITPAEIAAGVTPVSFQYEPGDSRRQAITNDSSTDHTAAFQAVVSAAAGVLPVHVYKTIQGSGYIRLTGRVTAPANTQIVLHDGIELRWTATAATGTTFLGAASRPGIEALGSNFSIDGNGLLRGPSSATYVANEIGILSIGTSSAARFENFYIGPNVRFEKWGYAGVALQFWDKINLPQYKVFDVGHAGFMALSCGRGRAIGIDVDTVGPGDGSNQAYGFSLTHDSTGYSTDPAIATPRLVANPFCNDWEVTGTVSNVPTWQGFDAHGGYEIHVHHLQTFNCRYGIQIANSSGDAAAYAGANNTIDHVLCTTKKRDGSATSISSMDGIGIVMNGGTTVKQTNSHLSHFVVEGYGNNTVTGLSVQAIHATGTISHGRIETWKGYGVHTYNSNLKVSHVNCGAVADATNAICFYEEFSSAAATVDWYDCTHRALGGTVAAEGMRKADGNARAVVQVDVSEATTPYTGSDFSAGYLTKGVSCIVPTLSVTGTPTSVNLTTAGLHRTPVVRLTLDVSGNSTITDLSGAYIGQVITFYAPTTNATTFDQTNAALDANADWVSSQYDTLALECVNTSGVKFVERSRAVNS